MGYGNCGLQLDFGYEVNQGAIFFGWRGHNRCHGAGRGVNGRTRKGNQRPKAQGKQHQSLLATWAKCRLLGSWKPTYPESRPAHWETHNVFLNTLKTWRELFHLSQLKTRLSVSNLTFGKPTAESGPRHPEHRRNPSIAGQANGGGVGHRNSSRAAINC
jgi:hypothetical protein